MTTPEHGVYLYAMVPAGTVLAPVDGEPDVRLVPAGEVAVVVGTPDVGALARINDPASDSDELAELAQRHDAVIRGVMGAAGSVLPFRLATVLADEQAAAAFAARHGTQFADLLRRLAGAAEWGVRISAGRGAPKPRSGRTERTGDRPGTAHLDRRRRELAESEQRGGERTAAAAEVARELGVLALDSVRGPGGGATVVDESYLVRDVDTDAFLDVAERARGAVARHGLRLRLTGPWPPYSFARLVSSP